MDYEESTEVSNPDAPKIAVEFKEWLLPPALTNKVTDPVDFEESSRAWMANKVRKGYLFVYRCSATEEDGRRCRNAPAKDTACNSLCRRHLRAVKN
jgi:hypothetical protein